MTIAVATKKYISQNPSVLWHDDDGMLIVRMSKWLYDITNSYHEFEVEELSADIQENLIHSSEHKRMTDLLSQKFSNG
jgi:hypothetical protein